MINLTIYWNLNKLKINGPINNNLCSVYLYVIRNNVSIHGYTLSKFVQNLNVNKLNYFYT